MKASYLISQNHYDKLEVKDQNVFKLHLFLLLFHRENISFNQFVTKLILKNSNTYVMRYYYLRTISLLAYMYITAIMYIHFHNFTLSSKLRYCNTLSVIENSNSWQVSNPFPHIFFLPQSELLLQWEKLAKL